MVSLFVTETKYLTHTILRRRGLIWLQSHAWPAGSGAVTPWWKGVVSKAVQSIVAKNQWQQERDREEGARDQVESPRSQQMTHPDTLRSVLYEIARHPSRPSMETNRHNTQQYTGLTLLLSCIHTTKNKPDRDVSSVLKLTKLA